MQRDDSIIKNGDPNYTVKLNRLFTYPAIAAILTIILVCLWFYLFKEQLILAFIISGLTIFISYLYLGFSNILKRYTNVKKRLKDREILLDGISLQGDEQILDVGCGNGILLFGAVKRLKTGKGTGIDIWTENSEGHHADAFIENAKAAGVSERVSLDNEDVRKLPYKDNTFDTIISGLTMHHIPPGQSTQSALMEMLRVLKPGGKMAIYDIPFFISIWKKLLQKEGLVVDRRNKEMLYTKKLLKTSNPKMHKD